MKFVTHVANVTLSACITTNSEGRASKPAKLSNGTHPVLLPFRMFRDSGRIVYRINDEHLVAFFLADRSTFRIEKARPQKGTPVGTVKCQIYGMY